jgi:aspartate/methionine/tyrosine aminotransferase
MEVVRAARQREEAIGDVLHLEVGQPSTGAPAAALDAARAALDRPEGLGYTDADGMPTLRRAIAARYATAGTTVDPAEVAVTTGASVGCVLAFLAAFQPGDRVAVCEPGYPCYRQMLVALGVEPVPIRIGPATRFQPTPDLLEAALPLDGVVVASPSNPTGSVLTPVELAALVDWCDGRDVRLVADEIYHGITFGPPAPTARAHPEARPIVINSFSKYFSMTGWRLGWLVLPPELVRPVELLAQNLFISPPTLSQVAAVAALDATSELDGHVARYETNRDIVLDGLARLGCTTVAPADGAFYCYAEVSHLGGDSQELSRRWLDELGVATTPGIDFDPVEGGRYIRLSFAGPTADVAAAMVRLAAWASR